MRARERRDVGVASNGAGPEPQRLGGGRRDAEAFLCLAPVGRGQRRCWWAVWSVLLTPVPDVRFLLVLGCWLLAREKTASVRGRQQQLPPGHGRLPEFTSPTWKGMVTKHGRILILKTHVAGICCLSPHHRGLLL